MHEFSIASEAVDRIMQTAQERKAKRIREVEVLIGELSLLGKEQFAFWLSEMLKFRGEITRGVKIKLKSGRCLQATRRASGHPVR